MKKKLLLVIDMQKDFITGPLGNDACRAVVPRVIRRMEEARAKGWQILCTRDIHEENYLSTGEGRRLPVPHCLRGSRGSELIDEIRALEESWADREQVFLPIHPLEKSAFGSLKLPQLLGAEEWEEIQLVGVCTDICVLSNAIILRSAYPEAEITVLSDCCAGVTGESHRVALQAMAGCQIRIL